MAARTSRIRFGVLMNQLARRRVGKVARESVTLDRLSGGRLILGAGLGSVPEEFTAFGEPGDLRERAARLDESPEVLTELWRGKPVTFHGEHVTVTDVTMLPPPLQNAGQPAYPDATRLLICADGGGSNGYRTRLWKTELTALAEQAGLEITVCHFPPGTSKWNKIEHRLFSHISMNWRGRPLTSHEVIVSLIASTRTTTGLTVQAALDQREYPQGIKIGDKAMRDLEKNYIKRHTFHGEWNYTLPPARSP